MKSKQQIRKLYLVTILTNLSLTGAWVAILAARGFSLVEIGLAETVFHICSLIFEIPSGILADLYGRKRMLALGRVAAMTGDLIMIFSQGLGMVCLSFVFHAMSYNFASGSGEALAYDSLKEDGRESSYEGYVSTSSILYRLFGGISTLCAGLALVLGYRIAYGISIIGNAIALCATLLLEEKKPEQLKGEIQSLPRKIWDHFAETFRFLRQQKRALLLMLTNGLIGAFDILLLFFLQAKLPQAGTPNTLLGPLLFAMELGGVLGARAVLHMKKVRYRNVTLLSLGLVLAGMLLEHTGLYLVMAAGGFLSSFADDMLQIRSDAKLNDMFPSAQRATLISVTSFIFSVLMIVLSPLAGWFYSIW